MFAGLDPGTSNLYGVVLNREGIVVEKTDLGGYSLPKTASHRQHAERNKVITDNAFRFLLRHQPEAWCLEGYSYGSKHHAHQLGEVGGVLRYRALHFASKGRLPFPHIVPPNTLKKFVTGRGGGKGTDKVAVAVACERLWGIPMPSEHGYDALVLAQLARAACGAYPGLLKYQATALQALEL